MSYRVREASAVSYIGVYFDPQWPASQDRKSRRSAEMGLRCPREPSPWIWTRNADKVRFWTENAEMFRAAFAAVRFFGLAANRRTYRMRSAAYAHRRKLHRASGK